MTRPRRRAVGLVAACALCASGCARTAPVCAGGSPLCEQAAAAAEEFDVPAELLLAAAWTETRFRMRVGDGESGRAWGLLQLRDAGARDVARGAAMAGVTPHAARTDARAHLRAAAALLRDARRETGAWRAALGLFGGAPGWGEQVLDVVARGARGRDDAGRVVILRPSPAWRAPVGRRLLADRPDYPEARWVPADPGNYANASRTPDDVEYVVVHTAQGAYAGTISWFQDPAANVSAHFVVRSSDGEVTQMVEIEDVAWHDACFNDRSVGIEHEGWVEDPDTWYTEAMYRASARVTRWLVDRWGVPLDRAHVLGHDAAPDCSDHTDPGAGWDWQRYLDYVRDAGEVRRDATLVGWDAPPAMRAGEEEVAWVEYTNDGNGTWDERTRLGTTEPRDRESVFHVEGNWLAPNRPTTADRVRVAPGESARFTFVVRAPEVDEPTVFMEHFGLLEEGAEWFGPPDDAVALEILVHPREPGDAPAPDGGGAPPDAAPPDAAGLPASLRVTGGCSVAGGPGARP